jgi:hypothetical protein
MTDNTQLTPYAGYDTSRMIFSEPQTGSIPGNGPKIEFKRVNISTVNEDGTQGDLILATEKLFSFGVSENISQETNTVSGYTLPLCLHNRDGPSEQEGDWVTTFNNIIEACIDHLIENADEVDKPGLLRSDLRSFNPLYYKKEKVTDPKSGKMITRPVEGAGPTLYAKLIWSKKNESFVTDFFDVQDNPVDPHTLIGTYCYVKAAVKIESIFVGKQVISMQVKIRECEVEPTAKSNKRLLPRPKADSRVLMRPPTNTSAAPMITAPSEDQDSESDSESESDGEEIAPPAAAAAAKKKPPARKVKAVAK